MKLYGLVIGINDYVGQPLNQAANDAELMKEYLDTLEDHFDEIEVIPLIDSDASRDNIIDHIKSHLYQATDDDVAILYYSGHGALEKTNGIFPDEHDQALDCMVCYSTKKASPASFLANKEVRYLFHKMPNTPHLVTVIDSCHSGDIVRSINDTSQKPQRALKRLSGVFPGRKYEDFIFAGDASVEMRMDDKLTVNIPFKPSVHLAACLSSESSWEDINGGVFTFYLLHLLEVIGGNLNYLDIARWAKLSIADITQEKQTPKISIQGDGQKVNQYSSWLNMNPDGVRFPKGEVASNAEHNWVYSRGSMLGMKKGMEVVIQIEDDWEETVEIKRVDFEYSVLEIPDRLINVLNIDARYAADSVQSIYSPVSIFLNDIDGSVVDLKKVSDFLEGHEKAELVGSNKASFYLNAFNGMLYFTTPRESTYQPIAEQIIVSLTPNLEEALQAQLSSIVKWNHFFTLDNISSNFDTCPIRVEAQFDNCSWQDVTNGVFEIEPEKERLNSGILYKIYRVRVTNLTDQVLRVGALVLNSDTSISSDPFDQRSVELQPNGKSGDTKMFYDHKGGKAATTIDPYKEVYNWKAERHYYKFIFNNFEDFTPSLQDGGDYLNSALPEPLTIVPETRTLKGTAKGGGAAVELEEVKKQWGTCLMTVELNNPEFNQVTGNLKDLWDDYMNNQHLKPMIDELYKDV